MARFKNEKKSGKEIPLYTSSNKIPLGLQENGKLATCPNSPNCFSTSSESQKNLLTAWSPNAGGDAMADLLATVKEYTPGQNGACLTPGGPSSCVDGGGFQIVSSTPKYLYVQFESLKYVLHAHSRTVPTHERCVAERPRALPAPHRPLF